MPINQIFFAADFDLTYVFLLRKVYLNLYLEFAFDHLGFFMFI